MIGKKVRLLKSSSLEGSEGIIIGERYDYCYVIEFTYVPKGYFQLPCTQVIDKRHVEFITSQQ